MWSDERGLRQDPLVAGWGGVSELASPTGKLQLDYWHTMIVGRAHPTDSTSPVELSMRVPWPQTRFALRGQIDILKREQNEETLELTLLLRGTGRFQLEPYPPPSDGFPIDFRVTGLSPTDIVIGSDQLHPDGLRFRLHTRDLHSVAVGELDGDPGAEYSVVRGGARGRIDVVEPAAQDVLFDTDRRAEINSDFLGFTKNGCPGRQSAWVDVDGDNRLELYIVCGRGSGEQSQVRNRLLRRDGRGFVDRASDAGIAFERPGSFRFIDWTGDLSPDFLWLDATGQLTLFENHDGQLEATQRLEGPARGDTLLLLHDLNADGGIDLFVIHHSGNRLVMNRDGAMEEIEPASMGLPTESMAGAFLDVDLDGELDFLAANGDLHRGTAEHRFEAGSPILMDGLFRHFRHRARLVSYGSPEGRELLLGVKQCWPLGICRSVLQKFEQLRDRSEWAAFALQDLRILLADEWWVAKISRARSSTSFREVTLLLAGPRTNPNSIGAHIELQTAKGPRRHWVGESESSHFSQGNFAIYVTIGAGQPLKGQARWQDGCVANFEIPEEQTRALIERPSDCRD